MLISSNGPVVGTTQWTYTVPSGRIFELEACEALVTRTIAAGNPAALIAQILIGGANSIVRVNASGDNRVSLLGVSAIGRNVRLNSGETLSGFVIDGSAGGTTIIETMAFGTESAIP